MGQRQKEMQSKQKHFEEEKWKERRQNQLKQ